MASSGGDNVNTDVRVTFPTPTGDPTVGADLQEFKAWVRQFDTGQTGDPDCRIELWENGSLVRAGGETSITGSGQMVTFTWNGNELGTADGSLVECKVVGTKSGGSPGARNTVDVGAVEWNVDYSAGATPKTIAATAVGVAAIKKKVFKSISATSVGVADVKKKSFVTIAGVGIGVADLRKKMFVTIAAASIGVAGLSTVLRFTQAIAAVATVTAQLTTVVKFKRTIAATATGVASVVTNYLGGGDSGIPWPIARLRDWLDYGKWK